MNMLMMIIPVYDDGESREPHDHIYSISTFSLHAKHFYLSLCVPKYITSTWLIFSRCAEADQNSQTGYIVYHARPAHVSKITTRAYQIAYNCFNIRYRIPEMRYHLEKLLLRVVSVFSQKKYVSGTESHLKYCR